MLDIEDFIEERGGNPERIRQSQRLRGDSVELVDQVIESWGKARKAGYEASQIGSQINAIQKEIGQKRKNKENTDDLMKQKIELEKQKKEQELVAADLQAALRTLAKTVGNYVHESVPNSQTEDDNETVRTWAPDGFDQARKPQYSHHDVLWRIGGYDPDRGTKLVGHRGYFLRDAGYWLNQALVNYGMQFLHSKGYSPLQPPYFLNKDQMAKTAQLSQFDEELYKVVEGPDPETDKYLIATSEQPISCMHANEWLQPKELPIKYAGSSTNFRKEAGSHGRDAWGIFRVHQFEKVEQFILCKGEESWNMFDEMIAVSEEFYKSLGLPYQIVSIVSGALNNAAAKKYDLEAWFPFQSEYKELVSCSNCTDYQTRELEIRFGVKKSKEVGGGRKEYVHALNATLCATERTLCCILENYQTEEGCRVPEVLRRFIPGEPDFIPFVKEAQDRQAKPEDRAKGKPVPVRSAPAKA